MRSLFLLKTYITPAGEEVQVCITAPHEFALKQQRQLLLGWNVALNHLILLLQKSSISLKESTPKVAQEKNYLRENFIRFGRDLIFALQKQKHSSDLFDPRTGYPLLTQAEITWDDNAAVKTLLNYPVIKYQHCSLLIHPIWQSNVYSGTIVTSAPLDITQICTKRIIDSYNWKIKLDN